jgi:Tfp pilus assembly protein PilO
MSTIADRMSRPQGGVGLGRFEDWLSSLRMPLEAWTGARRLALGTLIAVAVFGIGARAWDAADLGRTSASRAELADVEHRLSEARTAVARLSALRSEMAHAMTSLDDRAGSSIGNWHAVSALAAQSGFTLSTLEPAKPYGEGIEAARPVRLVARANFAGLLDFLQGLPGLPVLVVPADLHVKRDAGDLSISMTLAFFDALPSSLAPPAVAASDPGDDEANEAWFADPFAAAPAALPNAGPALQLVGLLREGNRGLALLAESDGAIALEIGQSIGPEKVTRIDDRGVTLSSGAGTRLLTLAEGKR